MNDHVHYRMRCRKNCSDETWVENIKQSKFLKVHNSSIFRKANELKVTSDALKKYIVTITKYLLTKLVR